MRQLFAGAPQYAKTTAENLLSETVNVLRGGEYFFVPSLSALRCTGNER